MESVDLILTADHYQGGAAAISKRFLRQARRGPFFKQAVAFLTWGILGAVAVVSGRMAFGVWSGRPLAAEADFALRTALLTAASIVPLSVLWFGVCEFRARRALRRLGDSIHIHFAKPFDLNLRWSGDGIAWESEHGSGGTPLTALAGYEEVRGLILLYVTPAIFIPVPADQLDPAQAEALRALLEGIAAPPLPAEEG